MIAELYSPRHRQAARDLMERNGLSFEEGFDDLVGIHETGRLVAVGARAGNILKMFAVEPSHQGGPLLAEMVTELVGRGLSAGFESLFVFTKPDYVSIFESFNFSLLASQGQVLLLEYGKGLERWLASHRSLVRSGTNGAVVMNCNPFTRGHRHLVEQAAGQVDNLYLFVVSEERSLFPFSVRMQLVRAGVADIANVLVLETSHYAISSATFPTYFLKKNDQVARIQMELDLNLFGSRIAPFFRISRRFAGSEPCCGMTHHYNETMKRILPLYGITLTEIERLRSSSGVISASEVRKALAVNNLSLLEDQLPESTLAFLRSSEADSIRETLRHDGRTTT
ncbi:MAG: [citrate (pro-3S)-lyase] ligase [Desulfuromonadales bacterium]|nr:[citrate (pro-3S)-lyase] ligase [Desulfuromonadales bacterium]